jgi:hypothetical protein
MTATVAQIAAVMAGMTVVAIVHMDFAIIRGWGLIKCAALAGGLAVAAALLMTVARNLS